MKPSAIVLVLATTFLSGPGTAVVHSADAPPKPPELKVLERFVGTWDEESTIKATVRLSDPPKERKVTGILICEWVLDGRFLQMKDSRHAGVQLWTYDPQKKVYRTWSFSSGEESEETYKWNEESKTLSIKDETGRTQVKFIDKDTIDTSHIGVDGDGKVTIDIHAKQTRRKAPVEKPKEEKVEAKTAELKVLDRLVGSWDTAAVSKPAVRTPKEVRTTSKVERKWVLGGTFLLDTAKVSDGTEGLSLTTYDPQMKAYRNWWFNSEGHTSKSNGQWDKKTETLSFQSDLPDGLTSRSSVRFMDKDRHEWKVVIKDGDGKVYFDTTWTVTRRKE